MSEERESILAMLQSYLELTHEDADEPASVNVEWDRGFQAAMALIRNPYNYPREKK